VDVVVIGAGAAGVATASELRRRGIDTVVLERGSDVAESWRRRYDALHLHTVRSLSSLPGAPIPRSEGRWVSRDGLVRYLERYAATNGIEIRTGVEVRRVERADGRWRLETSSGGLDADRVVVATGFSNEPFVPDWPGRAAFRGRLVHSSEYRNEEPYRGLDVLVVGSGNSGAEIATNLAAAGAARVRLAVRTPPQIARRDRAGIPAQVLGLVIGCLPLRIADTLGLTLRRLTIPDLAEHGLPRPTVGPATTFRRTKQIPILDVGFVDAVRSRRIEIVAGVEALEADGVVLADGSTIRPDAVIAATGFRPALEPLVGDLGILDERGLPSVHGGEADPRAPGLYFVGLRVVLGGGLRDVGRSARSAAEAISRSAAAGPQAARRRSA
jgi:putative flavoprotein involved in K+ transport